jgi:hypothetical protein
MLNSSEFDLVDENNSMKKILLISEFSVFLFIELVASLTDPRGKKEGHKNKIC